jgi:hypothetical protein
VHACSNSSVIKFEWLITLAVKNVIDRTVQMARFPKIFPASSARPRTDVIRKQSYVTKHSSRSSFKNLDKFLWLDFRRNDGMNMIGPSIDSVQLIFSKSTTFLERFFNYFSLFFVKGYRRPIKLFLHLQLEVEIWGDFRSAIDILTMHVHGAAFITMKPGSVASDRYQIAKGKTFSSQSSLYITPGTRSLPFAFLPTLPTPRSRR